ncbi:glucose 1-dehydrogenase [Halorientalis salina]|uniref:glucose 1-dehydrogenase n=1 Tax=Halorientalis salina TaxID=2932266 RepID=UPI0010ACFDE0|nr:glucose 1-dehydrogenase [Halorientalis salina]
MDAVVIERGETAPTIRDVARPEPEPDEALVRTVRVGIDGTDEEVIDGTHGGYPDGDDYMILGHEVVGVVETAPDGSDLDPGDAVVATVRRPIPGTESEYFERGEPDMAPPEECLERGIAGAHGFMSEYFTSPVETLVELPRELLPWGFLVEPISVSEKALELAAASRSAFDWRPESAFVLGNGSLGLLTLAMLDERGYERLYCMGRRSRPDPSIDVIESLGATYVDSRETPLAEFSAVHEPVDLVYEATGYARHGIESTQALAPNGVAALLGLPSSHEFEVDGGAIHKDLVMHNKALVGSVNANRRHFEAAVETLAALPEWLLSDLVTSVTDLESYRDAFAARSDDDGVIKTAIEFSDPDAGRE